jgi:cytochrome c oxidase subunit 2/cytochrome aa3-600 menaquinol oxidase subunit 2
LRHPHHLAVAAGGSTFVSLSGCNRTLSTLHPAGAAAAEIAEVWWFLLVGSVTIFVLVMALLCLALRRRRPGDAEQTAREGVWFWGLGLAFPMVTLAVLTGYGLIVGERLEARVTPDLVTVRAEAQQWSWSFGYADAPGRVTENVLHIPAGRPVDVEITSRDVIHSFWVPRLAGKLDAIPGHVNRLRIEADLPGDYAGQSGEFSGRLYREHVFTLRAHDPAGWAAFLAGDEP